MWKRIFYKLFHSEAFQGDTSRDAYFEGWYFKIVTPGKEQAIAIIPGIALHDASDRHAFIQWIDGTHQRSGYHRFPLTDFLADKKDMDIRIGPNRFSKDGIWLDLPEIRGEIRFHNLSPLNQSLFQPGIMGWYTYVPAMQCYHGIVSLHHRLTGRTEGLLGEWTWDGGTGYIEKDWGTSFPKCWIWVHTNHFDAGEKASLMASIAHIPWMGHYFPGFIVVLWIEGREYRFATYNGAKMKCQVQEEKVNLAFKKGHVELKLVAYKGPTAELRSPLTGRMTGKVNESLQATVEAVLEMGGKKVWTSTGHPAGLEIAGDTSILETDTWRK